MSKKDYSPLSSVFKQTIEKFHCHTNFIDLACTCLHSSGLRWFMIQTLHVPCKMLIKLSSPCQIMIQNLSNYDTEHQFSLKFAMQYTLELLQHAKSLSQIKLKLSPVPFSQRKDKALKHFWYHVHFKTWILLRAEMTDGRMYNTLTTWLPPFYLKSWLEKLYMKIGRANISLWKSLNCNTIVSCLVFSGKDDKRASCL